MCGRCNYVNKLESKYYERAGCNYPLTQLALDEYKAPEQAMLQELANKSNIERDNTIQALQQELKSWEEVAEKMKTFIDRYKKEEKERHEMYEILDKLSPGWKRPYIKSLGKGSLTKEWLKKFEEFLEKIRAMPDYDNDDSVVTRNSDSI